MHAVKVIQRRKYLFQLEIRISIPNRYFYYSYAWKIKIKNLILGLGNFFQAFVFRFWNILAALILKMTVYADLNDPEIQESLKYLQVSTSDKIKFSALPFDGKKQCWVPDQKEGFVVGEIENTIKDDVVVKTSKGEVNFKIIF